MLQFMRFSAASVLPGPQDQFDHGNNADTFILIPGFTQGSSSMESIGGALSERHNVMYVRNLPWYTGKVKDLVAIIMAHYETAREREKNGDISIVGHSYGGVLGARMVSENPKVRVNRLLTAGSPHDRVPLSLVISGIPMIPVPPVLHELDSVYDRRPSIGKRQLHDLTTIAAGSDLVVPTDSQDGRHLPMSPDIPKAHQTWDGYSHFDLLEPKGAARIAEILH